MSQNLQTVVFLVRHGETDRYYSQDPSRDQLRQLTERGARQAAKVGEYLAEFAPTAIYSSPLERCRDTAQIIKDAIGFKNPVVLTDKLLEIYSNEPRQEAGERGESIFTEILGRHAGEQVVAVTHQYIIGYIVANFRGVDYHDVPCDFADVYRLTFAATTLVEAVRYRPAANL